MSINELDLFKTVFDFTEEAILISDEKGNIVKANNGALKLFGYAENEIIGQPVEILMPNRFRKFHPQHREDFNNRPQNRSMGEGYELYGLKKDHSEFPISVGLSHVKVEGKVWVVGFIIDISVQIDHKQKLQKLNSELELRVEERTKELAKMVNRLETTNLKLKKAEEEITEALLKERELGNMKSRFVSMASHEFRTPLSTILSSISLLEKYTASETNEKTEKHFSRIKSNVRYLTNMLNDFLSLEKLQTGKIEVSPSVFMVSDFLKNLCEELQDSVKDGQKIVANVECGCEAFLDVNLFKNIMLNLISNAVKYSGEGTEVIVTAKKISDLFFEVSVQDFGMGISEDEQRHIFERFFRAKNAENIQGTGLGLNLIKGFAELMNGELSFESKYGKGSTFTVRLPFKI